MGGDDSQKLLPWRGSYSSPGRSKPPALQTLAQTHLLRHGMCHAQTAELCGPASTILTCLPVSDLFPMIFELSKSGLKAFG